MPDSNLERAVGRVEADIKTLMRQSQESERKADESRQRVYARLEAMERQQIDVARRLEGVESQQRDRIIPFVDRLEMAESSGKAIVWAGRHAWRAGRWLVLTIITGIVMFWREILAYLRGG